MTFRLLKMLRMNNEVMTDFVHFSLDWLTKTNGSGLHLPLRKHILSCCSRKPVRSGLNPKHTDVCWYGSLMKSCLCFWVGQAGKNDIGAYWDSFCLVENFKSFNLVRLFCSSHKQEFFPENFFCKQNVLPIWLFRRCAPPLLLFCFKYFTRGMIRISVCWGSNLTAFLFTVLFYVQKAPFSWSLRSSFVWYSDWTISTWTILEESVHGIA